MKIIEHSDIDVFIELLKKRSSTSLKEDDTQKTVRKILMDVRSRGDSAVLSYTKKFDAINLTSSRIEQSEIEEAAAGVEKKFIKALRLSAKRIRDFHKRQQEKC